MTFDIKAATTKVASLASVEMDRLSGFLAGLDEEGWQAPSACEGWTVRDVVNHLGVGSKYFQQVVEAKLAGQPLPNFNPEARQALIDFMVGCTNQQAAQQMEEATRALIS